MDWLQQIPFPAQLAILFVAGLFIGSQVNRAIYRLSIDPKHYDPWTPPLENAPPRQWWDHLPVIGWLGLRREVELHGNYYWIRPLLLELSTGAVLAGLYAWEMNQGLLPLIVKQELANGTVMSDSRSAELQSQYLCHVILFLLLLVASMIDMDEKLIPDEITTPGTLLGLFLFSAFLPASLLPDTPPAANGGYEVRPLLLSDPLPLKEMVFRVDEKGDPLLTPIGASGSSWPVVLDGWVGLVCGLAAYSIWWAAVVDLVWRTSRGVGTASRLLAASVWRERGRAWRLGLLALGLAGVTGVWFLGAPFWPGMLSSLAGMLLGGGVILMFRIVGGYFLSQEAMGYGDVTLMAMVGAFLGWQPTLIAIFLAPLLAVGFSIGQWLLTGRKDIYFGPFLSVAAMFVVVMWGLFWLAYGRPWFLGVIEMWQYTLILVVAFPLAMGILLQITRAISRRLWPDDEDDEELAVDR